MKKIMLPVVAAIALLATSAAYAVQAYIICSFQSKYALALYEAACLRGNLQVSEQKMSVAGFRALLGISEGKWEAFKNNMKTRAIDPAVEEVTCAPSPGPPFPSG